MLFQVPGLRAGLCAALRIQLSDAGEVRCAPEPTARDLADRLSAAADQVRAQGARLGVLIERDPDPGRVRMYILSSQTDQAVIAIERIEDRPDPDVDRSLALKVRNAYDVLDYVETTRPKQAVALASTLSAPPAPPKAAPGPAAPDSVWVLLLDAGSGLGLGNGLRAASSFALGLGHVRRERRFELAAGARLYSWRSERKEGVGKASMVERGPYLSARWLGRWGRFELGGLLEAQLSLLRAEGVAGTKSRSVTLTTAVVGLGVDLRVRLFASAYLRFAPSLELPLPRRRLEVQERVLIQDAPVRAVLPLALVVTLPLARHPESLQP